MDTGQHTSNTASPALLHSLPHENHHPAADGNLPPGQQHQRDSDSTEKQCNPAVLGQVTQPYYYCWCVSFLLQDLTLQDSVFCMLMRAVAVVILEEEELSNDAKET